LSASTFLGGGGDDYGYDIAIDSSDNVFVTGKLLVANFPTTDGAYDELQNGSDDVFVSKFSNDLTSLSASTFLGGSNNDYGHAIAIDSSDNVFVTGRTISADFPTTDGAYDDSQNDSADVFVSKFSNDLTSLSASTFLGGSKIDIGYDIVIDSSDNVFVTGETNSLSNLPVGLIPFQTTDGAYDELHNGSADVFVSKFSNDLTSLSASTFLGSNLIEYGYAIAIDSSGNVFVTGYTGGAAFPTTSGAYDELQNTGSDVFVSKFSTNLNLDVTGPTVTITSSSGDSGDAVGDSRRCNVKIQVR
jgi:hypothetical protein